VLVQFIDTAAPADVGSATVTLQNPLPVISNLNPSFMNIGLKSTIAITGTGFLPSSKLQLDGQAGERYGGGIHGTPANGIGKR
jgi:hypothetical protein